MQPAENFHKETRSLPESPRNGAGRVEGVRGHGNSMTSAPEPLVTYPHWRHRIKGFIQIPRHLVGLKQLTRECSIEVNTEEGNILLPT